MKYTISIMIMLILSWVSCKHETDQKVVQLDTLEVYSGPIIDMHIHANRDASDGMFGMEHPRTLRGQTFQGVKNATEQKEQTLERFKKYNIVKAMVSDGELWYDDAPDIVMIGGRNKSINQLKTQFDEGKLQVIGEMAPFYGGILADHESLSPYFALAQELNIPVGFHIFPGGPNYGYHLHPEFLGGMRTYNASPLQLEDVLIKFPDLKVYIMHGGWPYIDDVKALMYAHPQVYVELAVLNWIFPEKELHHYIKQLIRAGFGDRIMYGSDQMAWPEVIDIGIKSINSAPLSLEQKEDIFYDNAATFLGLSEEEIKKHKNNQ